MQWHLINGLQVGDFCPFHNHARRWQAKEHGVWGFLSTEQSASPWWALALLLALQCSYWELCGGVYSPGCWLLQNDAFRALAFKYIRDVADWLHARKAKV